MGKNITLGEVLVMP